MAEFAKALPELQRPLIDERDQYLISGAEAASGRTIVAVVGAGHVPGMTRYFQTPPSTGRRWTCCPPPGAGRQPSSGSSPS